MAGNSNSGRRTQAETDRLQSKQDEWRKRIWDSRTLESLLKHIEGKKKMAPTQVNASLGLLKKVLPDMTEGKIEIEDVANRVVNAQPIPEKEWEAQYQEGIEPIKKNGNGSVNT